MPEIVYREESYAIMGACFELRATDMRLGLLINFSAEAKLEYERVVL